MKIIKRNGREVEFEKHKIASAIAKAWEEVYDEKPDHVVLCIADDIENAWKERKSVPTVEKVQDMVEEELMARGMHDVARAYIRYRYDREKARNSSPVDDKVLGIIESVNEEAKQENSNKNPTIASTQRDYMAGEISKDISKRYLLPKDVVEAHDAGIIHFHDMDYYAQHISNCCLVNLEDMLQNGTVISETMIEKPHMFSTACNIATQIIAQVASSQYGGQSISLAHLSPFVEETRKKYREMFIESTVEKLVREDIRRGIQTLQYQILTLMTTNGQTPFITVYMNINEAPEGQARKDLAMVIEEVLRQRIEGVKNEVGVYITPAFPKLIYVLDENNAKPGSEYHYLTELAAECTAKRMVPDYISAKMMRKLKVNANGEGDVYTCMGCRSFLTPDRSGNGYGNVAKAKNYDGKAKYYGRFNQGVVTINLVDVALSSGGDMAEFWRIFEERLELCHKAVRCRHERLLGTKSDVAPIFWQHGAIARLGKGEVIDPLLYGGYSTISLGYAGLYECTKYMTGHSHTEWEGHEFAKNVMQKLNDSCSAWKAAENIDYSVYGTPLESTTYKFATCLRERFGTIEGITDHDYITNSYHVNVREEIDAFSKLAFEAEFQALSPGGAISYVEVPNLTGNIPAVLAVMEYIYDNIMYAELNTKSDYCQVCGYDGEIQIVEEDGKLIWECPKCGNRDESRMSVCRRVCGYLSTNYFNQGRTQEIRDRVMHL